MKKFISIISLFFAIVVADMSLFAQESCYQATRSSGISEMNQKKWRNAIAIFEQAKHCPDLPRVNDLDDLIRQCRKNITSNPPISVKLLVEKDKSKITYTKTEWEKLSQEEKIEVNKIGVIIGEGQNSFLLSLFNNNRMGDRNVNYTTALNKTGGQMPTKQQWQIIKRNKTTINDALQVFGGNTIWYSGFYWCKDSLYIDIGNYGEFEKTAGYRMATDDIDGGFKDVVITKQENEDYDFVGNAEHDYDLRLVKLRDKYGFIDKNGDVVIPIKYDSIFYRKFSKWSNGKFVEEYAYWNGNGLTAALNNGKWGYVDRNDSVVIPFVYDKVERMLDDITYTSRALKDDLIGLLDSKGHLLMPIIYKDIEKKSQLEIDKKDLYYANKDGKYGFWDNNYNIVVPFKYDFTSGFTDDNMCAVGISDKYGYINNKGEEIIPLIYDFAAPFYEGLAAVVKDGKLGYINTQGKNIIPFDYEPEYTTTYDESSFVNRRIKSLAIGYGFKYGHYVAYVRNKEGKIGAIDKEGKLLVDFKYDNISSYGTNGATVEYNGHIIYLDKAANEYSSEKERNQKETITMAEQGYSYYQYLLGVKYLNDGEKTLGNEWLLKAANQGSEIAMRKIAENYTKDKEYQEAVDWYKKAVDNGDVHSLLELGDLYFYYYKIPDSFKKTALECYQKYLENDKISNRSVCLYRIGLIYYYGGNGVSKSYKDAYDYFNKSSVYEGKYYIGYMYEYGQGVEKNIEKAIEYYIQSRGERDSKERIENLKKLL